MSRVGPGDVTSAETADVAGADRRVRPDGEPSTAVQRLTAERRGPIDAEALCARLATPGEWLGEPVASPDGHPETRRVETDLVFPIAGSSRTLAFRKAALVDITVAPPGGERDAAGEVCVADIAWRAASFAPLFPVFAGRLHVRRDGLRLDGNYAPPGGGAGLVVDRILLHHVAERVAEWFLGRLAAEVAAGDRGEAAGS